MCRFLLAKSEKPFNAVPLLQKFAEMSKISKALDGDWQGDGCGISWLENNIWKVKTSIDPIWENVENFSGTPKTKHVVMHARSASFPQHKGILEYNQPYVYKNYVFVFNGLLKGVGLPYQLEGTIGAQKIWSLILMYLKKFAPNIALEKAVADLNKYSQFIQALNIGLSDGKDMYIYNQFASHKEYYSLQTALSDRITLAASEKIEGYKFKKASLKKVEKLI